MSLGYLIFFVIFGLLVSSELVKQRSELAKLRAAPPLCQALVFELSWWKPFWNAVLNLLPQELTYLEAEGRADGQFLSLTIERWRSHTAIEIGETHVPGPGPGPRTRWVRAYGDHSPPSTIWSLRLDEGGMVGDWPTLELRLLLPALAFRHAKVAHIQLCAVGGRFGRLSDPLPWPVHSSEPRPENVFLDIPLDMTGSDRAVPPRTHWLDEGGDSQRGFYWSLSVHDLERRSDDLLWEAPIANFADSGPRPGTFIRAMRSLGRCSRQLLRRARTSHP